MTSRQLKMETKGQRHVSSVEQRYTIDQAAELACRTPNALRILVHRGRGPRFRLVGGRLLVSASDLDRWLDGDSGDS